MREGGKCKDEDPADANHGINIKGGNSLLSEKGVKNLRTVKLNRIFYS